MSTLGFALAVAPFFTTALFAAGAFFSSFTVALVAVVVLALLVARVVAVGAAFPVRVRLVVAVDVVPVAGVPTRADGAPFVSTTFLDRVAIVYRPNFAISRSKVVAESKANFDRAIFLPNSRHKGRKNQVIGLYSYFSSIYSRTPYIPDDLYRSNLGSAV